MPCSSLFIDGEKLEVSRETQRSKVNLPVAMWRWQKIHHDSFAHTSICRYPMECMNFRLPPPSCININWSFGCSHSIYVQIWLFPMFYWISSDSPVHSFRHVNWSHFWLPASLVPGLSHHAFQRQRWLHASNLWRWVGLQGMEGQPFCSAGVCQSG